jgi:multidrug efflux pump subunit AcrA (membrane-fusion protein)
MRHYFLPLLITCLSLAAAGCEKKEAVKPPDLGLNVTTAEVIRIDMPVVESAVGTLTSLSLSKALDPTRVTTGVSTVRLPFPAHVAGRLKIDQPVTLSSFDEPDKTANGRIVAIRPALNTSTDSMDVIVGIHGARAWSPSGSIRGEVVMAVNKGALGVPEQAIAIRPAGSVVYTVENGTAKAHTVTTGITRNGLVEIREGLRAGDTVVVDGASLLTDGARINVRNADSRAPQGQKQP